MKFNWRFFCLFGILWSLLFGGMDFFNGNMAGAKIQFIFFCAYAAGLVWISLKEHKPKDD